MPKESEREKISSRALAYIVLTTSLVGTFFAWAYIPYEGLPIFVLAVGLIMSFLLFGILYLLASSVELKRFSEDVASAKANIEREKAKYEALLAGIGDGVVAVDHNGDIIFVNHVAEAMLGWRVEEAMGQKWYEILQRVDEGGKRLTSDTGAIHVALSAEKEAITTRAYYYLRKDGTKFPVAITVTPIILNGEIIGAIDVFRDITHEKEVDRAKTEFVSLASHQLRTPLSVINWYSEMLLSGDAGSLTPAQKEYLEEIYSGSKRMVRLVNDLLSVSRLATGRLKIDVKPVDLAGLLVELVNEAMPLAAQHGCKLSLHTPREKLSPIPLDPSLMRQVVQNLISNAINYSLPQKSPAVEVALRKHEDEVEIIVKDNGIGIPREAQSRIYEKFFRAENAIRAVSEGTGLGLYIVKMVTEAFGSRIWFESGKNEGTTFHVIVPLYKKSRVALPVT